MPFFEIAVFGQVGFVRQRQGFMHPGFSGRLIYDHIIRYYSPCLGLHAFSLFHFLGVFEFFLFLQ